LKGFLRQLKRYFNQVYEIINYDSFAAFEIGENFEDESDW